MRLRPAGAVAHRRPPAARHRRLDDLALRSGILFTVGLGVLYLASANIADRPLTAFVLPTLLAASIGGPRPTLLVSLLALAVAGVAGLAHGDISTTSLLVRLGIIVVGLALGTALAGTRRRGEDRLHDMASTASLLDAFQRRLVPVVTTPAQVLTDERYVPGEDRLSLGGDFVDLIRVDGDRCAFVLGDVSGHGPDAAAFGAAVRAGWKSLAVARHGDPVWWLETLQTAFFTDDRFDGFVTALAGWIEPADRSITLASAGHCWPVIVGDRTARLAEMSPGVPLGVAERAAWSTTTLTLAENEQLLLYTDGLIENRWSRGGAPRCGEDGLLGWLRDHATADGVDLDALLADLGPEGFDDDVAVVTLGFASRATATDSTTDLGGPQRPEPT